MFASRSAMAAEMRGTARRLGIILTDGKVTYISSPDTTSIPDLPDLLPFSDVSALHWGVAPNERAAAKENAARLNQAAEYCRDANVPLHLPAGSIFIADRIDLTGLKVLGQGISAVQHVAARFRNQEQTPAPTQIVMTGEAFTPLHLYGISSMKACGAARQFTSPREGLAETDWELVSLVNADATDGAATPADLVVGIVIEGGSGAHLEGFRVVADSGGPHGLDGYNDDKANRIVGQYDIGILQIGARNTTLVDLQTVGHFRRYGYLNAAIDTDGDYSDYTAPYETTLVRCNFQGMRGFGLRGPDRFVILDWSATHVDLPWANDHPFTLTEGLNKFRLTAKGTSTSGGKSYTYTGVAKVTVQGEERIRLSGLSGFDTDRFDAVVPTTAGGANSHIVLRDCQIGGLLVPSGHAANDKDALENPVTNGAIGGFEISGWRCAEADIQGRIQHPGTIAGFIHDGREIILDLLCEAGATRGHDRGMTWIVSPQYHQNRHAAHPAGGNRWLEWRYGMITERSSSGVDFAPFMGFIPRPTAMAGTGDGWFEGYWTLRSPRIRYYTREDGTDTNYLPAPALAIGPDTEGYRGRPPQDLLHLQGNTDQDGPEAALRLSDGDDSLRLALARTDGSGAALRVGGGLQVAGPLQAEGGVVFPPVAADALADRSHPVNMRGKSPGKAVFDSSNGRCLVASGSDPEAAWNLFDGTPAIRPG
ncbi:hypothetical protein [Salipiger bermudensis]|uniref:hypothetical protein n=1 Tax=Salipiger bermudensis TaxID=344736 RepID=UPI001A8C54CC|nr:hypothetical protein [Salipiger bermudensis]MBN9678421.1 hypothetical protein [Salipiger bermudensis]